MRRGSVVAVRRLNEILLDLEAMEQFTKLQGRYLAFIAAYTKLNRRAPAEADFQRYFEVTPPSVHNMIVTLERRGLIKRTPGRSRSIEISVPAGQIPLLD
jgi:DNA-binding MarR family transcriptional regulator